jgi:galactokinase
MDIKLYFQNTFETLPERCYFSPGRLNLIGEHIDYNGGLVFPAAINLGIYAAVSRTTNQTVRFSSMNYPKNGIVNISLSELTYKETDGWTNYAKGVILYFKDKGYTIDHGFDMAIFGTLPTASGLSSSASLLVLMVFVMCDMFNMDISRTDMALIAQHVENNYMGMHCGIMDQLIIAKGVSKKALLMNTATLETHAVSADFEGYTWVIMNTNYQRKTTDSKYNERVAECKIGLKNIRKEKKVKFLCELSMDDFKKLQHNISDEIVLKRVRHVVSEQKRVIDAKKALELHDAKWFGKLLNESHQSLKEDYEVTGLHLDTLVREAIRAGAIGARVTGAGFGGCAIALVPNDRVLDFMRIVGISYLGLTQIKADFYTVEFVDGVHRYE